MHDCPRCREAFDSRRGLGVHHSSVHDELLPNRECTQCESAFHSEHEKKYCSPECRDEGVSQEGADNPNFRGGKETTSCESCGSAFDYYPSAKPGKYCESCLENEQWRHTRNIEGERNPRWSGGEETLTCQECCSKFQRQRTRGDTERVFCSPKCQADWLSKAFTGEGHPNWAGGGEVNYGPGWRRTRERTLERDDYRCVLCGATREELGRNPDVHHLVPVRRFVETPVTTVRDAHYLGNLASLCIACHRRAEFGHVSTGRLQAAVDDRSE